ncbi:MAG: hypothetical protein MRY32_00100 [Rickettsiales bacterium]|nr:hypothetical protein [Rickettsiales bacterium]
MALTLNDLNNFNTTFTDGDGITSQDINDYYDYLSNNGIEYGDVAKDVANGDGFFGEVADDFFDHVMGKEFPNLTDAQINQIQETLRDELAKADLLDRITNMNNGGNGEISYEDINGYHKDIFNNNGSTYEAWTGAAFDEFFGYGSYMDGIDPDINVDLTDFGVGSLAGILDLTVNDINLGEFIQNLFESGAWQNSYNDFDSFVDAGMWGLSSFGQILHSLMYPASTAPIWLNPILNGSNEFPNSYGEIFNYLFDETPSSPLVLDLDQDNLIELSSYDNTNQTFFDLDADGFAEQTGWVSSDDGLLAIDLNADGVINDIGELFGNATTDGFIELAALDSNSDGIINNSDTQFGDLLVWQDLNENGRSESGELQTLTDWNINEIDLAYASVNTTNQGHLVSSESTASLSGGGSMLIQDVWFEHNQANSIKIFSDNFSFDNSISTLPQLQGSGEVSSLSVAMNSDASLKTLVENLVHADYSNFTFSAFKADVEDIAFKWLGVDSVNSTSRGAYIDARILEGVENWVGREFVQSGYTHIGPNAATLMTDMWSDFVTDMATKLLLQIPQTILSAALYDAKTALQAEQDNGTNLHTMTQQELSTLLNPIYSDAQSDYSGHPLLFLADMKYDHAISGYSGQSLADFVSAIEQNEPSTSGEKLDYWQDLLPVINAVANGMDIDDTEYNSALANTYLDQITSGDLATLRTTQVMIGTAGADTLQGGSAEEYVVGGLGDDVLYASYGDDTYAYYSGDGNDTIDDASGDDTLLLGPGITANDLTYIRPGTTNIGGSAKNLTIQIAGGGSIYIDQQFEINNPWGIETIQFDDESIITSEELREIVLNQSITTGDDTVRGYDSEDTLTGDTGNDLLIGGSRVDTYYYYSGDGHDTVADVDGYSDDEVVFGSSINIEDITFSVSGQNLIMGIGSGSLTIQDQYRGGSYDIHNFTFDEGTLTDEELEDYIDDGTLPSWWPTTDPDVALAGTANADTLTGGSGDDTLWGNGGDDELYAYAGADQLYGGDGNDQMNGGDGDDIVAGDLGDDIVWGDAGADTVTGGDGADTVYGGDGDDNVDGGDGSDFVTGDAGNDYVFGNGGSDQVYGHTGNDSLFGQDGDDTLKGEDDDDYVDGGAGNDGVYGDDGNDVLYGQDGSDWLDGGAGADYIHGGAGSDGLVGGAGADIFLYTSSTDGVLWQGDWIYDFAQGTDKLDLSALATGISVIGTSGFSGNSTAELRYNVVGSNHQYHLDANGDSSVDLEFITVGQIVLTTSDLLYN